MAEVTHMTFIDLFRLMAPTRPGKPLQEFQQKDFKCNVSQGSGEIKSANTDRQKFLKRKPAKNNFHKRDIKYAYNSVSVPRP
jgi:hypothetical protein